jgi:hypothetical protein
VASAQGGGDHRRGSGGTGPCIRCAAFLLGCVQGLATDLGIRAVIAAIGTWVNPLSGVSSWCLVGNALPML